MSDQERNDSPSIDVSDPAIVAQYEPFADAGTHTDA